MRHYVIHNIIVSDLDELMRRGIYIAEHMLMEQSALTTLAKFSFQAASGPEMRIMAAFETTSARASDVLASTNQMPDCAKVWRPVRDALVILTFTINWPSPSPVVSSSRMLVPSVMPLLDLLCSCYDSIRHWKIAAGHRPSC